MGCNHLRECLKPNTFEKMKKYGQFVNTHHFGSKSHEDTVQRYTGTELGSYIDFDKMAKLNEEKHGE